ncbi:MAG TPA: DNRLRE domain-containing protein [Planctomycetota bacterium]
MPLHLAPLALLLASSPSFALPQTQTLLPVADARVSESSPDGNQGLDDTLRVRRESGGRYRSYLRFDLRGLSGRLRSARLRLYCTDGSPAGGGLFALADDGWSESGITWSSQPRGSAHRLAVLGEVVTARWVEIDVTAAVRTGTTVVFALAEGASSNSAYYSSREGAHPAELVVTPRGGGSGGGGGSAPVAEFSATPLTGAAPLQTVFTDQSSGQVASWSWSFGDGATSSAQHPVHLYANDGTYSVTLTVSGPDGAGTITKSGYVRVFSGSAGGVWTSAAELAALATTGSAWNALLAEANRATGTPNVADQDDDTDVRVLAKALVYARTGNGAYRDQVVDACVRAIGTEVGGRTLALGRNLIGYVLAADLVGLPAAQDTAFRAWLRVCLSETLDGKTLRSTHEERPNNWGTHAGASRAAVAAYLGDDAELARCAQVFRGWLGDRSAYAGFAYGDLSWQADPSRPVGINPRGATRNGHSIDGVVADDQRRAGGFTWPPPQENYVWEALQGALAQAVILSRTGYSAWEWEDQALLRAVRWLHEECAYPAEGDDTWQPHVVNRFYAMDFPAPIPSTPGKNVGWTDWTYPR